MDEEWVMDKKVILVVEDDELNLKLVREVLKIGGYATIEAQDAESGIVLAEKHKPDLILMDLDLPVMDGLSATRTILSDVNLSYIPIVALTALAMPEDRENALAAGCVAYVTKPFSFSELLTLIGGVISGREGNIKMDPLHSNDMAQKYKLI
jgi:two-component system, cell cycle response regulator DivK